MKIMTFNTQHCMNYITKEIDFESVANVIKDFDADIVGLNEMRGEGTDAEFTKQVEILSELTGMKYFYFAPAINIKGKGLYGNGFLSKTPILTAENIPIPDPVERRYNGYYETRCLVKLTLLGGLTVLVTHFGLNRDEQENAVKTVVDNIEESKCILMGDFNACPNDSVLIPIREKMCDTAEKFDEDKLSFPSYCPDQKIDYIFVSSDIEVLAADIPEIIVSDHRPHTAIINL